MIIANPIYDTVFKRLMENMRVAKFFIGTLLEQQIVSIDVKPQEFTFTDKQAGIAIYRLDFIAVIKTESGEHKKVLVEVQKARSEIDVMRFRNYLAEQYKKKDMVNDQETVLPITTIYVLGFTLANIKTACLKVGRLYIDQINNTAVAEKNDFIENLSHDCYVVQAGRVTGRYQTPLDKLLSVFEQANFVDSEKIIKEFNHPADSEEMKLMTDILHHSGTDPEERKQIEAEKEAWRTINAMFEEKERTFTKKLQEQQKELDENRRALEESKRILDENKRALDENKRALDEKDRVADTLAKQLEELKRRLGEV